LYWQSIVYHNNSDPQDIKQLQDIVLKEIIEALKHEDDVSFISRLFQAYHESVSVVPFAPADPQSIVDECVRHIKSVFERWTSREGMYSLAMIKNSAILSTLL
jgi:hypothetical protein